MTDRRRHDLIAYAILALVPTILFADILLGFNSLYARDIASYYYPAKKVLREIVLGGHFPYWNPFFSAGQPIAANPEHEVFYPLTWLLLLPDYFYAFHLHALIHIYIVTFSTYALLRDLELGRPAACFGALSFGVGGLVGSMLNLFPILFSVAWMPLTCLYTRRYLLYRSKRDFALAAVFLGIQLLVGEPTTALQTGILLGMYALYRGGGARQIARNVGAVGAISLASLLVAAVQVLPTIDHFGNSVRARGISLSIVSTWSMPFQRLGEIVYPHFFGWVSPESFRLFFGTALYGSPQSPFYYSLYCGLAIAVLALAGIIARVRGTALVCTLGVLSAILAAGSFTPLLGILHELGIARSSRYPEKFTLLGIFALVLFGSTVLDRILSGDERVRKASLAVAGGVSALAALALLLSYTPLYEPLFRRFFAVEPSRNFVPLVEPLRRGWLVAAASGLALAILLRNVTRMRRPLWLAVLGAFAFLDLASIAPDVNPRMPASFYEPPPIAQRFPPNRHEYRLFHFVTWSGNAKATQAYGDAGSELYWIRRNAMPPVIPAGYGLRTVHEADYDLTGLTATEDFTHASWELSRRNPRVWLDTIAAMSNIWYVAVYRSYAEGIALARGNVRELEPVRWVEGTHYPRYYFADQLESIRGPEDFASKLATGRFSRAAAFIPQPPFAPARGVVRSWREWPNGARLEVEAAGRAFLVMSVTPHKYWRVTVDGAETPAIVTNIGYQGIEVPPGRHVVEMRYRNPLIAAGGGISLAALLALALLGRALGVRRSALVASGEAPQTPNAPSPTPTP
ncbi:MAG: hypothetical protein QOJ98_1571 [Acidobacteriota bacterium]|nr:hypothetical protein [Acidobacteriota bacterium]